MATPRVATAGGITFDSTANVSEVRDSRVAMMESPVRRESRDLRCDCHLGLFFWGQAR
jgi:hypothetical protein